MRIADYLEQPDSTDLDHFITRLDDSADAVRRNMRLFVLGDAVKTRFDHMLASVGERLDAGRDVGRFLYGSFGSGKSHMLQVQGEMLEGNEAVYDLGDPGLRELRAKHPWLDRHKILVVRVNMMGKRSLASALYDAYNRALPSGVEPLDFTSEEQVFQLIDGDAERMGGMDQLLALLVKQGVIPHPDFYEKMRWSPELRVRLDLAAKLLNWRDHGRSQVRPDDLYVDTEDGLDRIARHAQSLGYTAVAWLVDELVIWIREKSREQYMKQINDLSAMVDHDKARVLPFLVVAAVQMDIAETCPQDLSEQDFRQQLGFISNRFQPSLVLEDQDLYEVAARRVLRRRDGHEADIAGFEAAVDRVLADNASAVGAMAGDVDPKLVRRLYPFNPALLRVLVDVTHALSRSRTAMAALYGLLRGHPDLTVGQFIPLGALWDLLFTPDNVQALRQNVRSPASRNLAAAADTYQNSLSGKIDWIAQTEAGVDARELHQLVRSVFLCQVSQGKHFADGSSLSTRITASMLLRLNQSDVTAMTELSGKRKVAGLFRKLSGAAPHVIVDGDTNDPTVRIQTENVNYEAVLSAARAEVTHGERFAYIRRIVDEQLGLELGPEANQVAHTVKWRGTKRKGRVRLANVRNLSYGTPNEFDAGSDAFLLLVDYPFDEDPHKGLQDDVDQAQSARVRKRQWTMVWLPSHFSAAERAALDNAAAVEVVRKKKQKFLFEQYSLRDAEAIAQALDAYQAGRRTELVEAVRRHYFETATVLGLGDSLDGFSMVGRDPAHAIDNLASFVLDKRYPNHPHFKRTITVQELSVVCDHVVRAAATGQPVDLPTAQMSLVDAFAVPLEVVYKGQNSISRREDGRYLGPILEWAGKRSRFKASDLKTWLSGEGKDGFGFTEEVSAFFLNYLLQVHGYEAQVAGHGRTIEGMTRLPGEFDLVKDDVVGTAEWDKAKTTAERLLGVDKRSDLPSVPEQSKLSRDTQEAAKLLKPSVDKLVTGLTEACAWAKVVGTDSKRLAVAMALQALVDELAAESRHADRVRKLADPALDASIVAMVAMKRALAGEIRATEQLQTDTLKAAVAYVSKKGSPEDQEVAGLRVRNALADGLDATKLADFVPKWSADVSARFNRLTAEDEERQRAAEEKRKADDAERQRLEAEERARAAAEAEARRKADEEARQKALAEEIERLRQQEAERQRAREEAERAAREAATKNRRESKRKATTKQQLEAMALDAVREAAEGLEGEEYVVTVVVERVVPEPTK